MDNQAQKYIEILIPATIYEVEFCSLMAGSETHWGRDSAFLAGSRCEIWMEIFIITGQKGNKTVNYGRWTEKCKTNSGLMRNSAHAHLLFSALWIPGPLSDQKWMQSGSEDSCYEIIKLFGLGQCFLAAQEGVLWYCIAVNWVLVTHQWNSKSKVDSILIKNILYKFRSGPSAFDKLICTIDRIQFVDICNYFWPQIQMCHDRGHVGHKKTRMGIQFSWSGLNLISSRRWKCQPHSQEIIRSKFVSGVIIKPQLPFPLTRHWPRPGSVYCGKIKR